MKKLLCKTGYMAAALVILYLLGMLSGIFAVVFYPVYYQQRGFLLEKARAISQEYPEDRLDTINNIAGRNMGIYIYDTDGNCTLCVASTELTTNALPEWLQEKFLPLVLSGKEKFRPVFSPPHKLNLATGIPIRSGDSIEGAVFLVKMQVDLHGAIWGFLVYFNVLYWLSAYFIVTYVRKKQKLEQVQQNYIANVTHALKSPIASVKTLTETLCDVENLDINKQRTYYGMILQEMNQQSHMVQEILELSKLQSRERDFTRTCVSASEIFAPIQEKYSMLCDCAHISFHVSNVISELPPLYTNASCVGQVLEILLENALKYTHDGCKIEVDAAVSKNQVIFCVCDNGAGIPEEDLPHVFERFYRCSRNKSGSGLGLAIAREIAAGLKEKLWVESEVGKGSVFFFTVRLK